MISLRSQGSYIVITVWKALWVVRCPSAGTRYHSCAILIKYSQPATKRCHAYLRCQSYTANQKRKLFLVRDICQGSPRSCGRCGQRSRKLPFVGVCGRCPIYARLQFEDLLTESTYHKIIHIHQKAGRQAVYLLLQTCHHSHKPCKPPRYKHSPQNTC